MVRSIEKNGNGAEDKYTLYIISTKIWDMAYKWNPCFLSFHIMYAPNNDAEYKRDWNKKNDGSTDKNICKSSSSS